MQALGFPVSNFGLRGIDSLSYRMLIPEKWMVNVYSILPVEIEIWDKKFGIKIQDPGLRWCIRGEVVQVGR